MRNDLVNITLALNHLIWLVTQLFVWKLLRLTTKKSTVLCIIGPLCCESAGNWWIPCTKGQKYEKCAHINNRLMQERRNSIAKALELVFLALTRRYVVTSWFMIVCKCVDSWHSTIHNCIPPSTITFHHPQFIKVHYSLSTWIVWCSQATVPSSGPLKVLGGLPEVCPINPLLSALELVACRLGFCLKIVILDWEKKMSFTILAFNLT